MEWRKVTAEDVRELARMNRELIEDEGSRNPMGLDELIDRMGAWLAGDYEGVVFFDGGEAIAYALYCPGPDGVYLRQFFVSRTRRREGVGRVCIELLFGEVLGSAARVFLEVLDRNPGGQAFWRAVGFLNYAVTMERVRLRSRG